jgi:antitoxin HigA-1
MRMKNPPHPGLSVRHDCLEPLGLSVTEGAKILGVSRKQLSDLVNCHAGISPEMAIRLDKAFGGGAETWHRIQAYLESGTGGSYRSLNAGYARRPAADRFNRPRHATHLLQLARVRLGNMARQPGGIAGIIANMTSSAARHTRRRSENNFPPTMFARRPNFAERRRLIRQPAASRKFPLRQCIGLILELFRLLGWRDGCNRNWNIRPAVVGIDGHFFCDGTHVLLRFNRSDIVADPVNMLGEWMILCWINRLETEEPRNFDQYNSRKSIAQGLAVFDFLGRIGRKWSIRRKLNVRKIFQFQPVFLGALRHPLQGIVGKEQRSTKLWCAIWP